MFRKESKRINFEIPLVDAYPHHALVMGLLESNIYDLPYLWERYIQLVLEKKYFRMDFSIALNVREYITSCPLLEKYIIPREMIYANWKSCVEFLKESICEGYAIYGLVDTCYIKAYRDNYGVCHNLHDILIHGFDEKEKSFYASDNFCHGKYSTCMVSYSEVKNAFNVERADDWLEGVFLIQKKNALGMGMNYNICHVKEEIDNYLKSNPSEWINTYEWERRLQGEEYKYGISVYNELIEHILNNRKDNIFFDIRPFYVLKQHKQVLIEICKHLYKIGKLKNADLHYKRMLFLKKQAESICNCIVKYNLTYESSLLADILKKLSCMKENEQKWFWEFQNSLCENSLYENHCQHKIVRFDDMLLEYGGKWRRTEEMYESISGQASVKCTFFGNGIEVMACKGEKYGEAQIYIDGKKNHVCLKDEKSKEKERVLRFEDLRTGYHEFVMVALKGNPKNRLNIQELHIFTDENKNDSDSEAEYLGLDRRTQGAWKKKYGKDGFEIIGSERKLPFSMNEFSYFFYNAFYVSLFKNTLDVRALGGQAYFLNADSFSIQLFLPSETNKKISFYCCDYECMGRVMRLVVLDGNTNKILVEQQIEGLEKGVYISFNLKGNIHVRFERVRGPDVVLSGVFFD